MSLKWREIFFLIVTLVSVIICSLILLMRPPGMELLGIGPNWLLIWVVAWSLQRSILEGAAAGLTLGLIQDGMTGFHPSHVIPLMLVGILTSRLQKQRYVQEDFISVALIVFFMAIVAETVMAIQFGIVGDRSLVEIWTHYQRVALSSAIISSLWAPVVYFPLKHLWKLTES
ncbi:MAG: rod shape-determining protein MreD [Cyanobacteriota bacterium]|nr:rod shape-determining protein MreD [Cyanobacteriota bacterium]